MPRFGDHFGVIFGVWWFILKSFSNFWRSEEEWREEEKKHDIWEPENVISLRFFIVFGGVLDFFMKKHSILHGRGAKWSQKTDTPHAEKITTPKKPSVFDTWDPFWLWKQRAKCGRAESPSCDKPIIKLLDTTARNPTAKAVWLINLEKQLVFKGFGMVWGSIWSHLEAMLGYVGASWRQDGLSWAILTPCCAILTARRAPRTPRRAKAPPESAQTSEKTSDHKPV